MSEKVEHPQPEKGSMPKCFLVDHGEFYGKEVTNGIVFVSGHDCAERELMESVRPGDLFFHLSISGLAAIGRAVSSPQRVSFPFWRYRECNPGELGYAAEEEIFLLPRPLETASEHSGYLSLLTGERAERFLRQILQAEPELAGAEWMQTVFPGLQYPTEKS